MFGIDAMTPADFRHPSRSRFLRGVKLISSAVAMGMAVLIGSGLSAPPALAGYVVTLEQVGNDVVATGSGPIDLSGLSSSPNFSLGGIQPNIARIVVAQTIPGAGVHAQGFTGFSGPTSFGENENFIPLSSFSGNDLVGISGAGFFASPGFFVPPFLEVPIGYISDSPLSNTSTYANQTLDSLGVTPGVYEWTWGAGADQNFTVDIVPEPSSLLLLAGALVGLGLLGVGWRSSLVSKSTFSTRFRVPVSAHTERDLPLPKTPKGMILSLRPPGIRGMSAKPGANGRTRTPNLKDLM